MGSAVSHNLDDSADMQEQPLYSTPSKRVLYVDPRSPSAGIDRTPILVEKTPPVDMAWDPRSPTPGIIRTPISNANNQGKMPKTADPLPPNVTYLGGDNLGLDFEESDAAARSGLLDPLDLNKLSLSEQSDEDSCHLIPANLDVLETSRGRFGSGVQLPVSKPLQKQLFSRREKCQNKKMNSSDTRSPLRSRNQHSDSPRNIIQRKQITSLDNKISCSSARKEDGTPFHDKENASNMQM